MDDASIAERLVKAQQRHARLVTAETRLRKLTFALGSIAVAEPKAQRRLIRSAQSYLERISENPIQGIKPILSSISAELRSLDDGVCVGIEPDALVLTTGAAGVKQVQAMRAKLEVLIAQLEAGSDTHQDQNKQLLDENRKFKEALPRLSGTDREFALSRMPVVFTFQNKQKHSSVGYVSVEALDQVGFKVQNFAGYTIIHNQIVLGVNTKVTQKAVLDDEGKPALDEQGHPITKTRTISDTKISFKNGKHVKVAVKRAKTTKDFAEAILKDLMRKANTKYEFVTPQPTIENGAAWYWIMASSDVKRLAKAMPGQHVGIAKWGFAS